MIILFIIGVLLGGVAVVFALQNIAVVTVSFFSWQLTGSLSVILLLALAAGALIAILLLLPEAVKNYLKFRRLKTENQKLADDLRRQKELTVFAKQTPPTEENIRAIENGVSMPTPDL